MKQATVNCLFIICLLGCTGCVSTSISDSIALIERENNHASNKAVNKEVLTSIQALRSSQKPAKQRHTFTYTLHNKELNYQDKIKITRLIATNHQNVTINIAPAKGTNILAQLALSMARAEVLRQYINHFNNRVTIKFSPTLTTDTLNLVTGA
ncbi:hypothetical protein [Colwellia piezophila]|uniref:hypothetical protein n=1 Tax=Colwellia piezophila TaxID=211668 RepID=UPI000371A88F|nr:hypothetical protein [Colwellia piezophila]